MPSPRKKKATQKSAKNAPKKQAAKPRASPRSKAHSKEANTMAKQHKQKLLDAKISRQRQRNIQMIRMRRKMEQRMREKQTRQTKQKQAKQGGGAGLDETDELFMEQHMREDSYWRRFCLLMEDALASLLYFFTVTMRSDRTFDWLVFLANNLGLYQEYEINDHGQRLSPRTGRPVLLSLGPFRVIQVVESANQVRSHWDPYIREFLRNSKLTTDCWRANRMALQVALCMDETGQMFDMPIHESAMNKSKRA